MITHLMVRTSTLPYYAISHCGTVVKTSTLVDHSPTCPDCYEIEVRRSREADIDLLLFGKGTEEVNL